MELWKDFILDWHKAHERTTLDLEFEYFTNVDIHRTLNEPGRRAVVEYLIQTGHAEWEDAQTRARCKLYWKKPQLWAAEIYQFASQRGMINNVYTVHELHSGEETTGASTSCPECVEDSSFMTNAVYIGFHGVEEWIIVKALDILEQSSKVGGVCRQRLDHNQD